MKKFLLLLVLLTTPAVAGDMTATVLAVHDGDTIYVRPEGDCLPPLFQRLGLRLNDCDTPELKDKRPEMAALAREARTFTREQLQPNMVITIKDVKWDKYGGRIDGVVEINGVGLCKLLINAGLAKEYHGVGAKPW